MTSSMLDPVLSVPVTDPASWPGQQIPLALTELAQRVAAELEQHYSDLARVQHELRTSRQEAAGSPVAAGIEVLDDVDAVRDRLDELSFFARRSILALQPQASSGSSARQAAQRPDNRSLRRGLRMQVVTDHGRAGTSGALTVRHSDAPLPCRLILIDSEVAVTTLQLPGRAGAAMVVREPTLLRALQCLFDSVWQACAEQPEADRPTPAEAQLLRLLLAGGTDESIARALGVSDRQVRRRMTRLYERLGAVNRFAAGAAAAHRGWL